ncbi:glycoside hydrolase [Lichtheimia hyalospora FSU 10163]|nr:glycoside hydrolase [Lichtheimia hyalospora FSU 10163]
MIPLRQVAFFISCAAIGVQATASSNLLSWEDARAKAKSVVDQMSIEQMVNLTTGTGWGSTCVGNTRPIGDDLFPVLCLQDGPIGPRLANNVTAGLSGITIAQTFDKAAFHDRGVYMGKEFRGKGINVQLGPCVDPMRSPWAGRLWEAFGEDPYLAGVATSETVKGIQSQNVAATIKHYIGNNQETNRTTSSIIIDDRSLHEVWLYPYARGVEAGSAMVMCSYNMLNGTYSCENEYTLTTILRDELGFQGATVADWGATHSTIDSANAGLDLSMPGEDDFAKNLTQAVKDGKVKKERLAEMAERVAATYYMLRQDAPDFPDTSINSTDPDSAPVVPVQDDHAKIVRESGAAAVVLLRNQDNVLPLDDSIRKIAIVGSDGGPNPGDINNCTDGVCDQGTLAMGYGSGVVTFPYLITPKEGIESLAGDNVEITYTYDDYDLEKAADISKDADVALVFANAEAGEGVDRANLSLWHNGDNLIKAVADANENTVVVIHAAGPVLMPWLDHPNIKAILWPGLPGQETGNSLADVLFGKVNPSGRLTYTVAKNEEDYSAHISKEAEFEYTEKLLVGYKWFEAKDIKPLFEFGFGLSYATFDYSDVKVTVDDKEEPKVKATLQVQNTGDVDGAEIPQAYISFPESAGEPPKLLRGFDKVHIESGNKEDVSFEFGKTELSIWDVSQRDWIVPSGEYTIHIGASSFDIRTTATFTL